MHFETRRSFFLKAKLMSHKISSSKAHEQLQLHVSMASKHTKKYLLLYKCLEIFGQRQKTYINCRSSVVKKYRLKENE